VVEYSASQQGMFCHITKVNPCGMKIFVEYLMMWHGICYKDSFVIILSITPLFFMGLGCVMGSAWVGHMETDLQPTIGCWVGKGCHYLLRKMPLKMETDNIKKDRRW
jgi:hypothetical protein